LPRFDFDTTATPYLGVESNNLTLPSNWVRAGSTQGMSALGTTLRPQEIEQKRRTLGAGGMLRLWRELDFNVDYRRTNLDGTRIQPGAFLTAATELAQPIDFTTDEIDIGIGYRGSSWNAELSYFGSFFKNDDAGYAWDNAFTTGNVDVGAQSQPPDNDFHQVALSGAWRGPARTTLTGRIATGQMEQNEGFLPYTVNPNLTASPLPRANLDGKVDTLNVHLRATSTPWRRLRVNAEYRHDDRDNKTGVAAYDYVVTDIAPGQTVMNLPYGYQRQTFGLDGDLRLANWLRVALGWDRNEMERNLQERDETESDRVWTKLRMSTGGLFDASLLLATEERKGSAYETLTMARSPQNPLMRKYNMADRDRDEVEFRFGSNPTDRLNIGFTTRYAEDDYDSSPIGVLRTEDFTWTIDGSFAFPNGSSLYGAFTREEIESDQSNSQNFGAPDWAAGAKDRFNTLVTGLQLPAMIDKLNVNLDYVIARSTGSNAIEFTNSTQGGPYPGLHNNLHSLRIFVDYEWKESTTFRFGFWRERFDSSDWALDGVQPATVSNLLSMGADAHKYDVNAFLFSVTYRPQ
ncbi:MAG: MtrB/PioB family decaheme-associated outer membrane protein, partial [Gammaproteobacteria bacterium]